MKVIIAGSRDIGEKYKEQVFKQIEELPWNITEVVSGGARGIDSYGEEWAKKVGIPVKRFIPEWDSLGKAAGYKRNVDMAAYADACFVFWDGISKGSSHMITIAKARNMPIIVGRLI
jgi:YspA, cpYpsA-related SLOG family